MEEKLEILKEKLDSIESWFVGHLYEDDDHGDAYYIRNILNEIEESRRIVKKMKVEARYLVLETSSTRSRNLERPLKMAEGSNDG